MKCVMCKVGETAPQKHTTFTFHRGETIIIIKDVPAEVCTNCGEKYVDTPTGDRLSELADTAMGNTVEVNGEPVTVEHYRAA